MGQLLIYCGPVALVAGLASVFYFYSRFHASAEVLGLSRLRYFVVALLTGVISFAGGTAVGIWGACSFPGAGNLCGLVGVFGLGPLLSGIAMACYGYYWSRTARGRR